MRLNERGVLIEMAVFVVAALVFTAFFLMSVNAETRQIVAENINFSNPFIVGVVILVVVGVVGGYFVEKRKEG